MIETRAVFDTSVIVSAVLLPRSVPRRAFDAVMVHGKALVSHATVAELGEVLRRPKFNRYVLEKERLEFLAALLEEAEYVEITEELAACRDPQDDKFLELAISGHATHIISGDRDLLALHPFRGIEVLSAQRFLTRFLESEG